MSARATCFAADPLAGLLYDCKRNISTIALRTESDETDEGVVRRVHEQISRPLILGPEIRIFRDLLQVVGQDGIRIERAESRGRNVDTGKLNLGRRMREIRDFDHDSPRSSSSTTKRSEEIRVLSRIVSASSSEEQRERPT